KKRRAYEFGQCLEFRRVLFRSLRDPEARPARRVGATAILVDGELAVWLEPRGKRIATGALPAEAIAVAFAVGLPRVAATARRRRSEERRVGREGRGPGAAASRS